MDAPDEPRDRIAYIADRKLLAFQGTVDPQGRYYARVFKQNQSLSAHVTADYHGRFLIELIQNGHDAHPRNRSDGEIEVLLAADEGAAGTLYVANRGAAFGTRNVDALCEMGLSSKPPGEAIGNKGLGFRSVAHITDQPEIYSSRDNGMGAGFDGYRFTFAQGAQLDTLLPTATLGALARTDMPRFFVPLWLDDDPPAVREFAARGFSTVIRLPLRDAVALKAVRDEIGGLTRQSVPVMLFLRRLATLTLRLDGRLEGQAPGDIPASASLRREEHALGESDDAPSLVDLGEAGEYLVARRPIDESDMKRTIAEGLAAQQLPTSWEGWHGDGEVALAIRLGDGLVHPRLYTFLPMGRDAEAPFNGYLHGSFFPSSNRKAIDTGVALNQLVLEAAIALAATTVRWIVDQAGKAPLAGLSRENMACATADLVAWRDPPGLGTRAADEDDDTLVRPGLPAQIIAALVAAFDANAIADAAIIPCLSPWSGDPLLRPSRGQIAWRNAGVARVVQAGHPAFAPEVVAEHGAAAGVAPIWPGLGDRRITALKHTLNIRDWSSLLSTMGLAERARVAGSLAASLPRGKKPSWTRWQAFYRDLPGFMDNNAAPLAGQAILFCEDGSLRAARDEAAEDSAVTPRRRRRKGEQVEASVFFPPKGGSDEQALGPELFPPAPLAPYFAFLAEKLPWFGELAAARAFLETKLVDAFESEIVLTRISQVVQSEATRAVRSSGLRWAFAVWRRSVAVRRPVALSTQYRLFVPTMTGDFIPAADAVFSASWPEDMLGRRLQALLEASPDGCSDLQTVAERRLAATSASLFGTKRTADWATFLEGVGVQRGLRPVGIKVPDAVVAARLCDFSFCRELGIGEEGAKAWRADVSAQVGLGLPSSTRYVFRHPLWWLPGQGDHHRFSAEARDIYAGLIIAWLETATDQFRTEVHHQHFTQADSRDWPTPVASFLRSAAWMPVDEPTPSGFEHGHRKPQEVWLPSPTSERYPPFLRRPSFRLQQSLSRASKTAVELLARYALLRTFNASDTLVEQLVFLTAQFIAGSVSRYNEQEFLNNYHKTWRRLADQFATHADILAKKAPPPQLIARCKGQTVAVAVPLKGAVELVYVRDCDDQIAPGLIAALGHSVLDTRHADPLKSSKLFKALYGARIKLVSEIDYQLRVSCVALDDLPPAAPLSQHCPWLRPMVAVALEALRGAELGRLPADRSTILAKLDHIEYHVARTIDFWLEGVNVTPVDIRPAYAFECGADRELVVALHGGELSWKTVESSLQAICAAIDQPTIFPNMRILARQLASDGAAVAGDVHDAADVQRLCAALMLDDQAGESANSALGERFDRQLPWFRAIVHLAGGERALSAWLAGEAAALADRGALQTLLGQCLAGTALVAVDVLDACKLSFSTEQVRERLALDFAAFNISLADTGGVPDIDSEGQARQLTYHVAEHEIAILDALRAQAAPKLDAFVPDPDYARLRTAARQLKPEPAWAMLYHRIPDEVLAVWLTAWLAEIGAPPLGHTPAGLPSIATVREGNSPAVRKFAQKAAPLARSWAAMKALPCHEIWRDVEADARLRATLDAAGVFDFKPLDAEALMRWCAVLGLWPAGMPLSLDRAALGIAETDVEAALQREREDKETREAEARSLTFDGKPIDPRGADWDHLSTMIAGALPRSVKGMSLATMSDLLPATGRVRRTSSRRNASSTADRSYRGTPQEKLDMIGRLGELVVYHWLKARLPQQDIDRAWISGNATLITGQSGDDGRGYDFQVDYRRQKLLIEVKASTSDPCEFEMGETEVRRAREVAQARTAERYLVAYVGNVTTPGEVILELLPNPMSSEGDEVLDMIGQGIRWGFSKR